MKKLSVLFLLMLLLCEINSIGQGIIGNGSNLYVVNPAGSSIAAPFPRLGIGTNSPSAQFHTTNTVRFQGLTQDNKLSRIIVSDNLGNLFWRDASSLTNNNNWLLTGNIGTNPTTNFLGTLDLQPIVFRTNNIEKVRVDQDFVSVGTGTTNVGMVINAQDRCGSMLPAIINGNTAGMIWDPNSGTTNTLGRLLRMQRDNTVANPNYFDFGIGQGNYLFITGRGVPTGTNPNKVFTISSVNGQDNVGINLGVNPVSTANFHTLGTVRMQGLSTNNTLNNIMVGDTNGNLAWRNLSSMLPNSWLLNGNTGTSPFVNFIGTIDAQPLVIRTNNIEKVRVDQDFVSVGTGTTNVGMVINAQDRCGSMLPAIISGNTAGMTWDANAGSTNTLGRLLRLQRDNSVANTNYFDFGIGQGNYLFITGRGVPTGTNPNKVFTISSINGQDNVGINLGATPVSTANFHTLGTVRMQGLALNDTFSRIMVGDTNGNLAWREASTLAWSLNGNIANSNNFIGTNNKEDLRIRTNNTQRMVITNAGNVGINTAGPFGYTGLSVIGTTLPAFAGNAALSINGVTMSTAFFATSDERMKTNIKDLSHSLDKILLLKGKKYNWNTTQFTDKGFDKNEQMGYLAQDLAKVLPEAVIKKEDGYYAVNYNAILPVITEAIKEQQNEIVINKNELTEKMSLLETENKSLKLKLEHIETLLTSCNFPCLQSISKKEFSTSKKIELTIDNAKLYQNIPNPFSSETSIEYYIPENSKNAQMLIFDMSGIKLQEIPLSQTGRSKVKIDGKILRSGMYLYSLIIDNKEIDTKRMILTK